MKFLSTSVLAAAISLLPILSLAQTVTLNGVVREEIQTKEGKIIVYLPDDIRSGVMITGTVIAEPAGNNEKEKNRNSLALQQYKIQWGDLVKPVSTTLTPVNLTHTTTSSVLTVLDAKNLPIKNISIAASNLPLTRPGTITTATHGLMNSPYSIKGPFDGISSTTKVSLDGNPVEILAESNGQTICNLPQTSSGPHSLTIEENGVRTEKKINAVDMNMAASRTNLRTGQNATITVSITGLKDIKSNSSLTMTNTSPSTITLAGGNSQQIIITPSEVSSSGTFTQSFQAQSIHTGDFTVSADLKLPEPDEASVPTTNRYIACSIANGILLLQEECEKIAELIKKSKPPLSTPRMPGYSNPGPQLTPNRQGLVHTISTKTTGEGALNSVIWTMNTGAFKNDLIKYDSLVKNNTSSIQVPQVLLNSTVTEIQAIHYSNSSPSVSLSHYIVTKTAASTLATTTSTIADLERKKAEAQSRADQEWAEVDKAQKERDRLTGVNAQLKKDSAVARQTAVELEAIDYLLATVGPMYQAQMGELVNSLAELMKSNPPSDINWRERCAKLEEKLIDCQSAISNLNSQLQALNASIAKMQADRLAAYNAGFNAIRNAGYGAYANKHFDGNGNMSAEYGIIIVSSGGQTGSAIAGIPAAAASQVSAQQQKIKDLNKAIQDAKEKQKQIQAMLNNLPAQCAEILKQLEDCRKQLENATAANQAQRNYEWELQEMCSKILQAFTQLQDWCKKHKAICNIDSRIEEMLRDCPPKSPEQLKQYWNNIQKTIAYKQQIESAHSSTADATGQEIQNNDEQIQQLDSTAMAHRTSMWNNGVAADGFQKQIDDAVRKQQEATKAENEKNNKPVAKPILNAPVNPSNDQLKFQALTYVLRQLYRDYLISKGPCDCTTKALALANNSNSAAVDIIGNIAVAVAFAPLEVIPGASLATRLAIGAFKALGSAIFGGQPFSDELIKNLAIVYGGDLFPKLVGGSESAGGSINNLASQGLDAIMQSEGVKVISWEGEDELKGCGKVKGKVTMMFNPNTGCVVMFIKIDDCPLIVISYQVDADGVPITKPQLRVWK